jgi:type 1 glutamine amidotransferase
MDKENRINPEDEAVRLWMTPDIENQITSYVANGGSFFAWHTGLSSYVQKGKFVSMLKGSFRFHPSINKPVKYITKQNDFFDISPVAFEVMDEHYFVECDLQNTNVFMYSESADGASVAGWAHNFGKGRVCCITPTHRLEGLTNPEFLKLLGKTVKWCCKI